MRPELELIEKIERYLKGELGSSDKAEFEKQLSNDPVLNREVQLQRDIMQGLNRSILKQSIQTAYRKYTQGQNFLKWGSSGIGIIVISAALLYFIASHHTHSKFVQPLPDVNETGTNQWSDADKYLPSQSFTLNTSKDTVIQTKGGIVMAIPANCFLDADGKPVSGSIEFEVKEALDPASIMKAGLSSKSGDRLLESAGMFYVNARKNNQVLTIDPKNGIYAQIHADSIKSGMQLFHGKRMPDGSIDWVNPKPIEHNLVPVDIHTLNFYPPLYLDSVAKWGYNAKNKKFTDSLYYSLSDLFATDTSLGIQHLFPDSLNLNPNNGAALFKQNCAACHSPGTNVITGPGMAGVINRVPQPSRPWLLKYIKNNIAVKKSGDVYANELSRRYNSTAMTVFDGVLTDNQINDIIAFLGNIPQSNTTLRYGGELKDTVARPSCGINPIRIKAIWNDEFQNTLISTKEFEARMAYIHKAGNTAYLDLYVNNLDKNLSTIDSMVADYLGGQDLEKVFRSFAARGDGKVAVSSALLNKLREFYVVKSKLYAEAIDKAENEFWLKQQQLDSIATLKENEHGIRDTRRDSINLRQEYTLNLKSACRQVADPDSMGIPPGSSYDVIITGTGWNNIDKYVMASTVSRTTLDYTASNGKHAIIKYVPVSFTINNYNSYDKIFVYLLPSQLSSFMRLSDSAGMFSEKLDELMKYNMACVAYRGDDMYFYSKTDVKPTKYTGIILKPISISALNTALKVLGNNDQRNEMFNETDYIQLQIHERKRVKTIADIDNLRFKTIQLIFPCFVVH